MIKSNIDIPKINDDIRKMIERREKSLIQTLSYIGERCVNEARNNGDYIDRSGNLRSSIGYVVILNGKIMHDDFKEAPRGNDRKKGISKAKEFASELSSRFNKGAVLIVVAGMNYATYVETRRNVLASAELLAERETPRMLREIGLIK